MSLPVLSADLWWLGVVLPLMAFVGAFTALCLDRLRDGGDAADVRRLAAEVERFAEFRRKRSSDGDDVRTESAKD